MAPFDAPANTNETPASPALWMEWPIAACAASLDLYARQWRVWADAQRTAMELGARFWGAALPGMRPVETAPPPVALAAADMRAAGAALWRAQMDAVDALRRSA